MRKLIECVPNFSEGRDSSIIRQITGAIQDVEGIKLLNVDPGYGANRTVVTFAGPPEGVAEVAFRAIKRAAELIDMRLHKGGHPRMGATDVCPLIPLSNITMDETVEVARRLAERVGKELNIPVYCYEYAAFNEKRRSLAYCRKGEYEGLADRLKLAEWMPDFGPSEMNFRSGATAIGARKILVAYNVNLNTSSVETAKAIASEIRESGGNKKALKNVRAMGWYIKEYGIAQVSMNLTDIKETPVHTAYEKVCAIASEYGVKVTGSELIGLIPLESMLEAGRYYLQKKHKPYELPEKEIIATAISYLGLDDLSRFEHEKRIIEYLL